MGRLIDATRLRTEVDKLFWDDKVISPKTMALMHRLIDTQPTAYDEDEVVAELKAAKGAVIVRGNQVYQDDYFIDIDNAISIVRTNRKE